MRVLWEQVGILGPVYRLASEGLNDMEIANKLNLTEVRVQHCVAWILHFLNLRNRSELVRYASASGTTGA